MSYLLDKTVKRKKFFKIALGALLLIILFFFRMGIFNGLSSASLGIFRPVLIFGNNIGDKFKSASAYFVSKQSLYLQNESLQSELADDAAKMSNYNSILADDASIKEILGRKDAKAVMTLAAILAKPNQSVYDTLIIDAGISEGIKEGDVVFAGGDVPIGRVDLVYQNSAKVILFSNAGDKTQAVVPGRNVFMELVGRGGGNFEMILPRDFILQKGDQVVMPGINPYVLGIVETIISDPRDPFIKALLSSPVNVQELKFVEVEQ
jgi:cell shape-determining protein MreC